MKHEDYVHRIGRTGRAGRTGQAITLATYRERGKIRALEDYLDARLSVSEIEGLEPSPPPARSGRDGGGRGRGGNGGRDGRRGGGFMVVVVLKAKATSNAVKVVVMTVHVVALMTNHVVNAHSVVKIVHVASSIQIAHAVKVVLKIVHVVSSTQIVRVAKVVSTINRVLTQMMTTVVTV